MSKQTKSARTIAHCFLVVAIALVVVAAIIDNIQLSLIAGGMFAINLTYLLSTQ